MWVWVTVLGLLLEVGLIVLLGRSATRGSEQDLPPEPAVGTAGSGPGAAVSPAGHRAGPAARR